MKKAKKMRIIACAIFVAGLIIYSYLLSFINIAFIANDNFGIACILSLLTAEFILHFYGYGWDGRPLKDEDENKENADKKDK